MARVADGTRAERAIGRTGVPPFQVFLDQHRTAVYRFLLASVRPQEADDCFQETFLAALRAYPSLRNGSNLRSWVLTIATRKAIDASRARARKRTALLDEERSGAVDGAGSPGGDPGAQPGPGEPFDATNPLWRAVQALPPRQRVAVVHRYVFDMTYRGVAAAMDSTEEAARANVYQAVKTLREELRDADF
jgi:RNA polymerase sigma factor (sigma-70 family)